MPQKTKNTVSSGATLPIFRNEAAQKTLPNIIKINKPNFINGYIPNIQTFNNIDKWNRIRIAIKNSNIPIFKVQPINIRAFTATQ